ncbi:hypothetical protein SM084_003035 [Cronobacter sakazakii]|uniref:hypothetical protein n=1 Tax=Cronobacter sakazakii TaxID=28141 RepID=UPI000BE7F0FE|nr:hypothetical protein [Cronobacter sakazakii]ELY4715252.1 hypothetical protein [Cronobacter sakazakii]ELY4736343.1 hypothetical protein [Cronobacter sakazakii]MDI9301988.1 hypothetical protein [Cronobacter sakazakii]MDI9350553.1 hypothetical protein [Cronobacter sakazakii]PUV57388.1 hypothetical protein CDT88_02860 [Cronobacter sakazakii]
MRLFWCGLLISVLYFLMLGGVIYALELELMRSWNEFGDFLAGAFSPVAFLWLVLGYIQQQKELQQNTLALELQAQELKNSVEQYKEMVSVAREQLLSDRESFETSKREKEKQYKPIIKAPSISPSVILGGKNFRYKGALSIGGEDALLVTIKTEPPFDPFNECNIHHAKAGDLALGESSDIPHQDLPRTIVMTISYQSKIGNQYKDKYVYSLGERGVYSIIDEGSL